MLNLNQYIEQDKLNREDPDYQIEDFWYGFKNSMKNFNKKSEIKGLDVKSWSDKLNKYKEEKNYSLIEESIKVYITLFAIDVMENEDYDECIHSSILLTNIKRWKKISNKFHFGNCEKYTNVINLFDAFCCVKRKIDKKLYPILDLFTDVNNLIVSNYIRLIPLCLELGQNKMLDAIIKNIGYKRTFKIIEDFYPNLTNNGDKNTQGLKICKRFNKLYTATQSTEM
jgi:hypothetical protein